MTRKYENFKSFTPFLLLLLLAEVCLQNHNNYDADDRDACAYMQCENNDSCVHRKFWCRRPPCPTMLYCAKSRKESLRGPSTCEAVRCSRGYICVVKVRRCRWDERCKQQIARCVSLEEYYDGPASCAGFKCPAGNHCILRESLCISPPCKLLKSCARNKDIQIWFNKCRELGCPSEFECFLRRPSNNCPKPPCRHTPDCTTTTENEMTNEHCRGWICPREKRCFTEIPKNCKGDSCDIRRTCRRTATLAENSSVYDSTLSSSKTAFHKGDNHLESSQNTTKVNDQHAVKKPLTQIENEPVIRDKEKRGTEISSAAAELEKSEIMGDVNQRNSGRSGGRTASEEWSSGSTNVGSPLRVYPTSSAASESTSDKFDPKGIIKPWLINPQEQGSLQRTRDRSDWRNVHQPWHEESAATKSSVDEFREWLLTPPSSTRRSLGIDGDKTFRDTQSTDGPFASADGRYHVQDSQFQNIHSADPSNFQREIILPRLLKTFLADNYDNLKNIPRQVKQETRLYTKIDDRQIEGFTPRYDYNGKHTGARVQSEQGNNDSKSRDHDSFRKSLPDATKNSYSSHGNLSPRLLHKNFMNLTAPPNETARSKFLKHSSRIAHTNENTPARRADKSREVSQRNISPNPFLRNYERQNVENNSEIKKSGGQTSQDDALGKFEELLTFYQNDERLLAAMIHLAELMHQRNQTQSQNPWVKQQPQISGENSKEEISTGNGNKAEDVNSPVGRSFVNQSGGINYIPFPDYFEINPLDGGMRSFSGIEHRVRNASGVPYGPLPFGNVAGFLQDQLNSPSFSENNPKDTIDKTYTPTIPTLPFYDHFGKNMKNSTLSENIPQRVLEQRHSFENETKVDKHERILIDKPQRRYHGGDITDSTKGIIKSSQHPPSESTKHSFQENVRDVGENRYSNKQFAGDYDWSLLPQLREYGGMTAQRNREKLTEEQPSPAGRKQLDFEAGAPPDVLFDNAAESEDPNQSIARYRVLEHAEKDTDENNEVADLLSFVDINKGNILAYIKALIEAINHDYDSTDYTEPISLENVMRTSSPNYTGNNIRQPITISEEQHVRNIQFPKNTFADGEYEDSEKSHSSSPPVHSHATEKLEDTQVSLSRVQSNQRVPSYGTVDHRIVDSKDSDGEDNRAGETGDEDGGNKFLVDYTNYN